MGTAMRGQRGVANGTDLEATNRELRAYIARQASEINQLRQDHQNPLAAASLRRKVRAMGDQIAHLERQNILLAARVSHLEVENRMLRSGRFLRRRDLSRGFIARRLREMAR